MKKSFTLIATSAVIIATIATMSCFELRGGVAPARKRTIDLKAGSTVKGFAVAGNDKVDFDTRSSKATWNTCFRTKSGLFLPGKSYVLHAVCKVESAMPKSNLLLLIRPLGANYGSLDVARRLVSPLEGECGVRLRFTIPENRTDYAFQIHTRNKAAGYVKDIWFEEIPGMLFMPAKGNARHKFKEIPTGAAEFKMTAPKQNGTKFSVMDCGASPKLADNTKAFNEAITHCASAGISRLIVSKGVYRFTSNKAITFNKIKDFEFDGQGSTFVFLRQKGGSFKVDDCQRVVLKNFNVDWDWNKDPLASVVKVEKVGNNSAWVDFRFIDYQKFPKPETRIAMVDMLDPHSMSVGCEGGFNVSYEFFKGRNVTRRQWLKGNLLRVWPGNSRFKPGQLFRMPHYYYDMRCFSLYDNTDLRLQDVNIWSTPGFAITTGRCRRLELIRTNIVRPPGSKRPITCTADHVNVKDSYGDFKMVDCEISFGNDDCLNIHDNSAFGVKSGERSVTVQRIPAIWRKGGTVELRDAADYSPTGFKAAVKSVKSLGKTLSLVELNKPIPGRIGKGFVLFNWRFDSHNIIIRNCYFHDNRARGLLLLARDVTVENCRFLRNQMGAIKIETGYTLTRWREGYGAMNIVIRNNVFDRVNPFAAYSNELNPVIYISTYLKSDPSSEKARYPILRNILIEKNIFKETVGAVVYASSADNVIIRNNRIQNLHPCLKKLKHRGAIGVSTSSNIFVTGNRWIGSYNVKPGLLYDAATVSAAYCWGNRLEKTP